MNLINEINITASENLKKLKKKYVDQIYAKLFNEFL